MGEDVFKIKLFERCLDLCKCYDVNEEYYVRVESI